MMPRDHAPSTEPLTCTTPPNAGCVARLMRRSASAGRALAASFLRIVAASFGHARDAEKLRQHADAQRLSGIEAISANLKHMKPHDPRRGQMTAKARSLRHEILRGKR